VEILFCLKKDCNGKRGLSPSENAAAKTRQKKNSRLKAGIYQI
jgi:hypothetical protein